MAAVPMGYLHLHGAELLEHLRGIAGKIGIVQARGEVRERASQVTCNDVKKRDGWRGVALDAQVAVQEHGGDLRGRHQVLQVAVRAAQLIDLAL